MFGTPATNSAFRPGSLFSTATSSAVGAFGTPTVGVGATTNPNRDVEVSSPPDDSIQALKFSPAAVPQNFLVSGSWDHVVRVWEVKQDGSSEPKSQKTMDGPVLEVEWSDDGSKIFVAGADKTAKMWDLGSDQFTQVAAHDAPIKTCHWMKSPSFSCLITGSWDKQLRFWDLRTPSPMHTIQVGERVYCADVVYPMAVVGTANRGINVYRLEGTPQLYKKIDSQLKFQHRCCSIFKDRTSNAPTGFAFGSIEGRVAIQYVDPSTPKDNFTFKCHRSPELVNGYQDIYAINDIAFHPQHGTLATVGSDGRYSFWDKDARTKLKTSERMDQAITRCCFNKDGTIFAYALSYDWSKGHEGYSVQQKSKIYLKDCFEDMRQKVKK